ncbi:hypothetical protein [Xanthobacter oligotrophicus]|uniref:hypothetical protein n=1 Tax=Xanthobacter oligotrophicus TaxID=2607286 RepID=UPI0011F3FF67|nr:hypothetical protein [Xanthobacter oligotrophicus]MCG5234641.1 hypothetical protein [Xanthobacter oligotrophicus]
MVDAAYAYKPRRPLMHVFGVILFGAGAYVMFLNARANNNEMIINNLIDLDSVSATIVFWMLFAACIAFCLAGVFSLFRGLTSNAVLTISQQGLRVPRMILGGPGTLVAWEGITHVRDISVRNVRFLELFHAGGKVTINEALLPQGAFDEVRSKVAQALSALHDIEMTEAP